MVGVLAQMFPVHLPDRACKTGYGGPGDSGWEKEEMRVPLSKEEIWKCVKDFVKYFSLNRL